MNKIPFRRKHFENPCLLFNIKSILIQGFLIPGEYNLTFPRNSAQGREFKKKKRRRKKGRKKGKKKRKEKGKRGKEKGKRGKGKKKLYQKEKKHNHITVLTQHKSGKGNSNDISFLVFLNMDNITFPSCLGGREINMIPKKI